MKTIDEVIKEIEEFWVCPSNDEADEYCLLYDIYQDALQYLKMYRSDQLTWEANQKAWDLVEEDLVNARMKYIAKLKELDIGTLNDPLTWDELRSMPGKAVWITFAKTIRDEMDRKGWFVIHQCFEPEVVGEEAVMYCNDMFYFPKKYQGTKWQAYRKERV